MHKLLVVNCAWLILNVFNNCLDVIETIKRKLSFCEFQNFIYSIIKVVYGINYTRVIFCKKQFIPFIIWFIIIHADNSIAQTFEPISFFFTQKPTKNNSGSFKFRIGTYFVNNKTDDIIPVCYNRRFCFPFIGGKIDRTPYFKKFISGSCKILRKNCFINKFFRLNEMYFGKFYRGPMSEQECNTYTKNSRQDSNKCYFIGTKFQFYTSWLIGVLIGSFICLIFIIPLQLSLQSKIFNGYWDNSLIDWWFKIITFSKNKIK